MHKAKLNIQLFASGTINADTTTMPSGTGKVEWSSSVISGKNQSTVTAICYCRRTSGTGNYCTVSGSIGIGSQSKPISKYRGSDDKWNTTWKEVGRFTTTVNHDANGTKSIKISFTISADTGGLDGTAKGDGTVQLDTINRASKLNAIANFNISDTITISIDKYVTDAVDTLQVKLGDTVIKEVANITNGYQLSFTDAEKTTISNLVSAPQATLTFLLTTVNGDTVLGSSTQTAVATLSSGSYFREIYKKENGKYQVAINGFVNTEINDVLQVYDDNGNLINGDTRWINATLTNDFKLYNVNSACRYRKIGNQVNIQFILSPANASNKLNSATETIAFVLPEGYRPSQNLVVVCQGSGTNIFITTVLSNGNVAISRYRSSSSYASSSPGTSTWLPCNITYFVD